jgi:acyl-CoA reductase-like NAD-dependent aldehyde dehydrogenase
MRLRAQPELVLRAPSRRFLVENIGVELPHTSGGMNQIGTSAAHLELEGLRRAQRSWAAQPISSRLMVLKRFREALAKNPNNLLELIAIHRGVPELEALTTEVMPLADACLWLERNAACVLKTRRALGAAPLSMRGLRVEIARDPLGLVLIIAPASYPLWLSGVQTLQGLAAGNAALLKPAPETSQLATRFRDALLVAGLPLNVFTLLPDDTESVRDAIFAPDGVDHVVLTGSARTGRAVQQIIAEAARPIGYTAALSGADVALVLTSANLSDVTKALRFGTNLNRGRTCTAPRLVLVPVDREQELLAQIQVEFANTPTSRMNTEESHRLAQILSLTTWLGAELLHIENSPVAVMRNFPVGAEYPWSDVFSPLLLIATYRSLEEAVAIQRKLPMALTASIFGNEREAREIAKTLDAGCVTINDVGAVTADPTIPATSRKASGQGVTRGAEGLLAMTTAKAIASQRSLSHPHWSLPKPCDLDFVRALLAFQHAAFWHRFAALRRLARAIFNCRKTEAG